MASYKHEKENLGYPITSIETEKDTSDVPEELEELDKPVKQSPGYSRVFEFDAILSSFIYKKSQEEEPSLTIDRKVENTTTQSATLDIDKINKEIDNATQDIDWKDLNKNEIKEYIIKQIKEFGNISILNDPVYFKSFVDRFIKEYIIERDSTIKIDVDVQDAINQYSDHLSKNKSKEEDSILQRIKKYWNLFKEEWPIDKIDLTQYLSDDLKGAIKVLNDQNVNDPEEIYNKYNIISSIAPIQLDSIYVFLPGKNVLHYISSDKAIQVGTVPVKIEGKIKGYPVLMNEKGIIYVPVSKKPIGKTERGLYKVKKGKIIFLDNYENGSTLIEGKDWMRLPVDVFVSKLNMISRHIYFLNPKQGEQETKHLQALYQVRNENTDIFSKEYFYVDDADLVPAERHVYSNLSEVPWISRDFSNSPETPISNSPIEEPGNPYYQSTHNSVVDYLAMPNVGDTLGERRIDRGYSGDAEYQDKDYIKLYKEKKKEELKNKVKKHPYYSFFLERDSI